MNNTMYKIGKNDWVYGNESLELPFGTYDVHKKAYWQSEIHKNSCSLHAAITVAANQFNIDFSIEDRRDIFEQAKKLGFSEEWGWYMKDAVYLIADWCRKNKGYDLKPIRVNWKHYRKLAYLGFGIVTGFKIVDGFANDRFDDGILDGSAEYGQFKYGHLISLWVTTKFRWYKRLMYVDNYYGKHRFNETFISHRHVEKLVAQDVLFPNGYIYIEN